MFTQKAHHTVVNSIPKKINYLGAAVSLLGAMALCGSGVALAADGEVSYEQNGIGVVGAAAGIQVPTQINHDFSNDDTEALAVDFGAEVQDVSVYISNLFGSENGGERGEWEAFDKFGKPVGSAMFRFDAGTSEGPIPISVAAPLRYLVFTARPYDSIDSIVDGDSSDYFVRSITYTLNVTGSVETTVGGTGANADGWAPLVATAFNLGSPYTRDDGSFADAEIIISTEACSGEGDTNDDCTVPLTDDARLQVTAAADVNGSLKAQILALVDPRRSCGNPDGSIQDDLLTPAVWNLVNDLGGVTGPIIPAHLCGTPDPNNNGVPTIHLLDADSDLTVTRSVLEFISDNTFNSEYSCAASNLDKRPVVGWLPKTSRPEVPVLTAPPYTLVPTLQDVTYACDSSRGGISRLSYLVWDLHHRSNNKAEYPPIIRGAITQLNATIVQSEPCITKLENKAVASRAQSATSAFDTLRYSVAKRQYIDLLATVSNAVNYDQCYFVLNWTTTTNPVVPESIEGAVPRNFRGDLIVQIRHILYMIDRMLGETKPALPAF